jgi:hypothetical protein
MIARMPRASGGDAGGGRGRVRESRAEADRTIAGLAGRRDALVEQLGSMQERLLAVARDLERTMEIDGPETPVMGPAIEDEIGEGPAPQVEAAPSASASGPADEPSPAPAATTEVVDPPPTQEPSAPRSEAHGDVEMGLLFADVDEVTTRSWEGDRGHAASSEIPALDLISADQGDLDDPRE